MNNQTCPKCVELSEALNANLRRAHEGDSGAALAVAKMAAALKFHRGHCGACAGELPFQSSGKPRSRAA